MSARGVALRPYVCPSELHTICLAVESGDLPPEAGVVAARELLHGWAPGAPRPAGLMTTPAAAGQSLTQREMRILRGIAAGHTNAQIGRDLYLAADTIKAATRRIFVKLGARDRASAVAEAYERQILRPAAADAAQQEAA